jgi:hypothetical protein
MGNTFTPTITMVLYEAARPLQWQSNGLPLATDELAPFVFSLEVNITAFQHRQEVIKQ